MLDSNFDEYDVDWNEKFIWGWQTQPLMI
jgi:hypothetical protein